MTADAWLWFFIVVFFFWVVPIALFFYRPKVRSEVHESWGAIPYENLKWGRSLEIMLTIVICCFTSWAMWLLIKIGVLVWK